MKTLLDIHLPAPVQLLPNNKLLRQLSAFPLNPGSAQLSSFEQGKLLTQYFGNYLIFIELYDCELLETAVIEFDVLAPAFFMLVMLKGHSVLKNDAGQQLSVTKGNCSTLSYLNAGRYSRTLYAGKHSILLFTFRQDWFVKRIAAINEFQALARAYHEKGSYCVLPHCAVAKSIYTHTARLNLAHTEGLKADAKILSLINHALAGYREKLCQKQYDAHTLKSKLHDDFISYVKANFTELTVEKGIAELARRFAVSEKGLYRMAREAFGKPLHKQIIEYRMLASLQLLLHTDKTVQEIALSVGYTDQRYFSTRFRKYFRLSPQEIRA